MISPLQGREQVRSQCNFHWTIKHGIPSNSSDRKKKKKKNDSHLPSWVGRIFSLAIEPSAGAVMQQPAFSQCCFLPPLLRFYSWIGVGGEECWDLSRLTWFYWGFTAGLNGGLQERLLCHLGCPQPLCYTVLKTSEEDCFKTRAWTLRHYWEVRVRMVQLQDDRFCLEGHELKMLPKMVKGL